MDIGLLNKLLMNEDVDPITGQIKRTQFYNELPTVQGLLGGVEQASQGPPPLPVESTPAPTLAPPVAASAQPAKPDFMQTMLQGEQPKNNWLLPVGLGLLQAGAGMAGPYYPGLQPPPWARGAAGLAQGMIQGQQLQKAEQDELLKKVKSFIEIRKAFSQPEIIDVGGMKVVRDPATGRMIKADTKTGTGTEAERLAETYMAETPGMSKADALAKAHGTIERAKGLGKLPTDPKNDADLVRGSLREKLGREPTESEVLQGVTQLKLDRRPEASEKEQEIILAAEAQRLGKSVEALTAIEKATALTAQKKAVAAAQGSGKIEGIRTAFTPMVKSIGDKILQGKQTIEAVRNTMGLPVQSDVMAYVAEKDPSYDFIQAAANRKWYESPTTQRLIRRTESIVAPGGPIDEALRMAKLTNLPAGTKLNELSGDLKVQLGNSQIQLLRMINDISAEEQQQIFGAIGGGEKFLELARGLADPNMSVEQYTNSLKEIRYLIMTRQLANVRGTPEQSKWESLADKFKIERPYLTPAEKKTDTATQKPVQSVGTNYPTEYNDPKLGKMTRVGFDPATNKPLYKAPDGSIKKVK